MRRDFNLVNLAGFVKQLEDNLNKEVMVKKSWGNLEELYQYNKGSQIFNRRLQFKPFVIVYCTSKEDVAVTLNAARDNNLPFRVRAGGHDHEGECTGTDTVLIDVSEMNDITVDKDGIAHVGPGCIFQDLTSKLAEKDVMIPHGTCATVGISGFTMGGGLGTVHQRTWDVL